MPAVISNNRVCLGIVPKLFCGPKLVIKSSKKAELDIPKTTKTKTIVGIIIK
jgi:hypothetical protein